MTKATQGLWLVGAGISLAVLTWIARMLQVRAHDDQVSANLVAGAGTEPFNNVPYLVAGIIAALLVLCGVMLYAADSASASDSSS